MSDAASRSFEHVRSRGARSRPSPRRGGRKAQTVTRLVLNGDTREREEDLGALSRWVPCKKFFCGRSRGRKLKSCRIRRKIQRFSGLTLLKASSWRVHQSRKSFNTHENFPRLTRNRQIPPQPFPLRTDPSGRLSKKSINPFTFYPIQRPHLTNRSRHVNLEVEKKQIKKGTQSKDLQKREKSPTKIQENSAIKCVKKSVKIWNTDQAFSVQIQIL